MKITAKEAHEISQKVSGMGTRRKFLTLKRRLIREELKKAKSFLRLYQLFLMVDENTKLDKKILLLLIGKAQKQDHWEKIYTYLNEKDMAYEIFKSKCPEKIWAKIQ